MIKLTRPLFAFGLLGLSLMPGCFIVGEESDDDDDGGGSSDGVGDQCVTTDDCKSDLVCSSVGTCAKVSMKEIGEPCPEEEECIPGSICFNEFCVGEGELRISLAFTADSDFDLHVLTPDNTEIYFGNSEDAGGKLDVDQCIDTCGTEAHAENVVFDSAASGTYEVWVVNYDGRAAGTFNVEVAGAVNRTFMGSLTATLGEESEHFTFTR
jgi:hypothetical protein